MFARLTQRLGAVLGLFIAIYAVTGVTPVSGRTPAAGCVAQQYVAFNSRLDLATQKVVAIVACETSAVRDLPPHVPVNVKLLDATGMLTLTKQLAQRDSDYLALQQSSPAMVLLGAMAPGEDLVAITSTKYNASAIAQYSQYDRTLYVRSVSGHFTPLDLAVVSHEYVRALQDQYFNLSSLLANEVNGALNNSDARMAREAIIEGDAFTTMLNFASATFDHQQTVQFNQQLQRTPSPTNTSFLQDLTGFPTTQGTTFVSALRATAIGKVGSQARQAAGNAAVNQALRNPPNSTAEVLDPELYARHVTPPALPSGDPRTVLGPTWALAVTDVLGAYGIGDLLQRNTPAHSATAQAAQDAASALEADRWALYQQGKNSMLVWRLLFSSTHAAQSFLQALSGYTGGRFHAVLAASLRMDWATGGFAMSTRQRAGVVVVVLGSDKSLLPLCDKVMSGLGFS